MYFLYVYTVGAAFRFSLYYWSFHLALVRVEQYHVDVVARYFVLWVLRHCFHCGCLYFYKWLQFFVIYLSAEAPRNQKRKKQSIYPEQEAQEAKHISRARARDNACVCACTHILDSFLEVTFGIGSCYPTALEIALPLGLFTSFTGAQLAAHL